MEHARPILERLWTAGHSAYLVGGCVRDALLRRPVHDLDIATSATPDAVEQLFPGSRLVGAHFGVMLVDDIEVATYRHEAGYADGRHPDAVEFVTNPATDAARRDFTINALYWDGIGEVLDFHGGLEDLRRGVIRAIGVPAERFAEDHLRLLRAVRFAARLGFTIEPETAAAIRKLAPRIHGIAAERVRDELTRILTQGQARRGFELLDELGLLAEVLPEVKKYQGVEQPPEFHPEGDVWVHTLGLLERLESPTPTLAWGALLHDAGKPDTFQRLDRIRFNGHVERGVAITREIGRRLRFGHEDLDQILALVANHMRFADAPRMKESTLKRFLRLDRFAEHLELHRLDCLASHGLLGHYDYVRQQWEHLPPAAIRPDRLLTGADLIAAGWTPGPEFRAVLDQVEDAQLEGRLASKAEALAYAVSIRPPASA